MSDRVTAARAARAVIESYVKGSHDGDVELLRGIFHPSAVMVGYFAGNLMSGSPEPFFQHVKQLGPAGAGYEAEIIDVQVDGKTAAVTLVERGFAGFDFVDRFHLVEEGGRWSIVSKLFHHD
ncbi:MAG: nuclear transport factor 2 family protein [Deltaproteobacteria bacterium]|nr:nuclear transport factor 2 family protein [Deltaproteobacteria bacterium]